jgi:hypothetical protein
MENKIISCKIIPYLFPISYHASAGIVLQQAFQSAAAAITKGADLMM